ncbi:MAG TPA: hypothetical protein VMR06_16685 [Dokdonella sp.]|uniref:hypothetical protein n=1 Tax=Dokdonella sp. TaxID=2291710 RepID=UPI002B9501FD|nr:hypothetical protein [Dokdonella sp.]HUD43624.1 hypothetical protein [Dokdonella sp.]
MRNDYDSDSFRATMPDGPDPDWASLAMAAPAVPVRPSCQSGGHLRQRRLAAAPRHAPVAQTAVPDVRRRPEWALPYAQRAAAQLIDGVRAGLASVPTDARALRRIVSALSADGRRTLARWWALQVATLGDAPFGGRALAALTRIDLALAAQVRRQLPRVRAELADAPNAYATADVA